MKRYLYDGISLQNKRSSNMDSLLLKEHPIDQVPALLAVVCDGVGSTQDGAFAASFATRSLADWFGQQINAVGIGLKLRDAVSRTNECLVQVMQQNNLCAASTLSALLLLDERYYIVHVGDSRIYACGRDQVELLTQDHVSQSGKLTAWIGSQRAPIFLYEEGEVNGRAFLLCSDGGYRHLDDGYLLSELNGKRGRNQKKMLVRLAQAVVQRGELDNITLALVTRES